MAGESVSRDPLILVTNVYHPIVGGISTYVNHLAKSLQGDFDVQVVSYPASLVEFEALGRRSPIRWITHLLFVAFVFVKVLGLRLRGRKPVVSSHSASFCLLAAFLACQIGAKAVHTFHSPPTANSRVIRWLSPHLNALVFVSPALRDMYSEIAGASNRNEMIIPGAVDSLSEPTGGVKSRIRREVERSLGILAEATLVLFVGRIVEDKGVHVLASAAPRLAGAGIFTLVIGPTGSSERDRHYLARVMELAGKAAEAGRFRVLGSVPNSRLEELYTACDIVVVPSIWREPVGLVAVEAMAHGKAVIASDTGGLPFVVPDGRAGLLVPPGDTDALVAAIHEIAGNPELRNRLEAGALDQARQHHSLDAFSSEYHRVFVSL